MNHHQMLKPLLIGAGILAVLAVAGVPVLSFAPLLILLLCPLMMIFMMRGMDHGGAGQHDHGHASVRPDGEP